MPAQHKILVVDDERLNRTILSDLLGARHQVILAKNGEQALEILAGDHGIDLILLDVMMPDMDGYEVLGRIKLMESARELPVIFITAMTSNDDEERGLELGAADYIGKPFSPAVVRARVENHLRMHRQRKMLEEQAGRDGLTEICNRRRFNETLMAEWRRGHRQGSPLSVVLIDVDHFKLYNDTYGHARGDDVLRAVAGALASCMKRPADLAARYGGEEFALVLPDTPQDGALVAANNARAAIEALGIGHRNSATAPVVTASFGVATMVPEGEDPMVLVERADASLYEAKKRGRNCVGSPG